LERLVSLHFARGQLAACREAVDEGLAIARASQQRIAEGRMLAHVAGLASREGRIEDARQAIEGAIVLTRGDGSPRDAVMIRLSAAAIEWVGGGKDRARDHVTAARALCAGTEDARLQAWATLALGSARPSD